MLFLCKKSIIVQRAQPQQYLVLLISRNTSFLAVTIGGRVWGWQDCINIKGVTMAREFAKWFYDSPAWRKCRASYISKRQGIDGGMCERCREKPGYIVHHKAAITPANINDPDVSLSFRNFEYVCQECHNKAHGKDKPEPRVMFTEDGDVCPILPP